uniref:Uncharacterized protein n=1 Tax=Parastrongyloides trichosuri TaxID=131310 RepID=A0A0N4ZRE9_PARTI
MYLLNYIYILIITLFIIKSYAIKEYKWDSERQAAARFLTEKIFGAVMNKEILKVLHLPDNAQFNRLKYKKFTKNYKSLGFKRVNGVSRSKLNSLVENSIVRINEPSLKHSKIIFTNSMLDKSKIKSYGNFKINKFIKNEKFGNLKPKYYENSSLKNNYIRKMIKVEPSPYIRELAYEDHDLDIVAPNLAGIKTFVVDEPLRMKHIF